MNTGRLLAMGGGLGGALAYFFDPQQGRRRRALVRDKARRAIRRGADAVDATWRDARNRARGVVAETRGFAESRPVSDRVLEERARARLGLFSSHPRALDVTAANGCITVRGPILAAEASRLLAALRRVRGVARVESELELHETADVAALQGPPSPAATRSFTSWRTWSPTGRAALTFGAATVVLGTTRARRYFGTIAAATLIGALRRGLAAAREA